MSTIRTEGEFVELDATDDLKNSPVYNEDLAPTKIQSKNME